MGLSQVSSQQQLINLLDLAVYVRNVSFFVLTLLYLRRASIKLEFIEREEKVVKISGPWRAAILYALEKQQNEHYDAIFEGQFFDLNQHQALPLPAFVDALCDNFTRYQRFADGQYAIVPTPKQKAFLQARLAALPPSALRRPPAPASSRAVAARRHALHLIWADLPPAARGHALRLRPPPVGETRDDAAGRGRRTRGVLWCLVCVCMCSGAQGSPLLSGARP